MGSEVSECPSSSSKSVLVGISGRFFLDEGEHHSFEVLLISNKNGQDTSITQTKNRELVFSN